MPFVLLFWLSCLCPLFCCFGYPVYALCFVVLVILFMPFVLLFWLPCLCPLFCCFGYPVYALCFVVLKQQNKGHKQGNQNNKAKGINRVTKTTKQRA
jgi:hypothetical protein